jgi:hypothetical protein
MKLSGKARKKYKMGKEKMIFSKVFKSIVIMVSFQ